MLAEDLKIARRDNKAGCSNVNQFFIMLMTSPKSGKGAEQEHRDSTLSISEHKRRQNYPRQLSTFKIKYSIDQRLRLSGRRKTVTIIERYHPGSSHQPSSVNEQKIISSKKFKRPYDLRDYLVKTQNVNFSMFLKNACVIERPKFMHLQL